VRAFVAEVEAEYLALKLMAEGIGPALAETAGAAHP
jgi:hypothetical protein